ncbi:uncharacterized protein LOC144485193 [Mustelus asterias]
MQNPWIFLALLLGTPTGDAAELNNNVLAHIVSSFRRVARVLPSDIEGGGQFSFLMALTADQCENDNRNLPFIPGRPDRPSIKRNSRYFMTYPAANYIAVYRNSYQCSEYKILHPQPGRFRSAAEEFVLSTRDMPVGCVILYTTYAPCTRRCFSDDEYWCIIDPILNLASRWSNQNIGKYLVFSNVYRPDTNENIRMIVRNKIGEVALSGFNIRKCNGTGYPVFCHLCNHPDYCTEQVTTGSQNI